MSLRTRLIAALIVLATAGLVTLAAVTYAEQRSFLLDRVDQQARDAQGAGAFELAGGGFPVPGVRHPPPPIRPRHGAPPPPAPPPGAGGARAGAHRRRRHRPLGPASPGRSTATGIGAAAGRRAFRAARSDRSATRSAP